MAAENPLWDEERIANELLVKRGIRVSPRTVGKYMPKRPPGQPRGDQRWSTFLKNHAKAILACDFFVAVTATFRILYVFVVIEHGTRRLAHVNVTVHPSADWTLKQLREVIGDKDGRNKYLIHDRDRIFAKHLDDSIRTLGVEALRSPIASPKANSICERVIGTIRRECLDWTIPMSEIHLRSILREWTTHYNHGRPHSALGPGVPDPPQKHEVDPKLETRHRLATGAFVLVKSVPGGLHHENSVGATQSKRLIRLRGLEASAQFEHLRRTGMAHARIRILRHLQQWRRDWQPRLIVLGAPLPCHQVQDVTNDLEREVFGNALDLETCRASQARRADTSHPGAGASWVCRCAAGSRAGFAGSPR